MCIPHFQEVGEGAHVGRDIVRVLLEESTLLVGVLDVKVLTAWMEYRIGENSATERIR